MIRGSVKSLWRLTTSRSFVVNCRGIQTCTPSNLNFGVNPVQHPSQESGDGDQNKTKFYVLGGMVALGMSLAFANSSGMFSKKEKTKLIAAQNTDQAAKEGQKDDEAATLENVSEKSSSNYPITKLERSLQNLPEKVPYLIVGGGTAAFAASRAIRSKDPSAKILVINEEKHLPYMRPPLSKELWFSDPAPPKFDGDTRFTQWNGRQRSLYFEPPAFFVPYDKLISSKGGISVIPGVKVTHLDPTKQIAYLDTGDSIAYGKCLVATGGRPKMVPILDNSRLRSNVSVFRSIDDFNRLNEMSRQWKRVAIIGGGFLGSELACALGQRAKPGGLEVVQLFQEKGNMAKVLPEYLSEWTTEKVRNEGVKVMPETKIKATSFTPYGKLVLHLNSGKTLEVDHAVVALGIVPDTKLAEASKLEIDDKDGGFRVNAELEARSNLWVAGDAASFYDITLGRRRVEHHDHAIVSGRLAGENMVSDPQERKPYTHQSMFWSDLGPEVGYEAIGLVDSTLDTVAVFAKASAKDTPKAVVTKSDEAMRSETEAEGGALEVSAQSSPTGSDNDEKKDEKYGKGVIFYLKDGIVVGVLLWNVFGRMSIARKIIREHRTYEDLTELAKLFNLHEVTP